MNLLDYVAWRGDLTFEQAPFNEIDNLIFTTFAYLEIGDVLPKEGSDEKVSISEVMKKLWECHNREEYSIGLIFSEDLLNLADAMANCERFKRVLISHYINHIDFEHEKQFCAMTFHLDDKTAFVAFRGTDDTIVGWKEDFNMSFQTPVPSQKEAVSYIKWIMTKTRKKLRVGGHSKGGNLAIYGSAFSGIRARKRIIEIYNNDGPGFTQAVTETEEYQMVQSIVQTFVPQSSIIGMLLEHEEEYYVVHSTGVGILQHNPFSWELCGTKFIYDDELSASSKLLDHSIREWILNMDDVQKAEFVEGLFQVISQEEFTFVSEFSISKLSGFFKNFKHMDEATRKLMLSTLKALFDTTRKQAKGDIFSKTNK